MKRETGTKIADGCLLAVLASLTILLVSIIGIGIYFLFHCSFFERCFV